LTYDCIIVNGDSYSANLGSLVWADALGAKLNAPVVNLSALGCCNDRILRSTLEYLEKSLFIRPLVVIGWSFVTRAEIWYSGDDQQLLARAPDNKDRTPDNRLRFLTLNWFTSAYASNEIPKDYKSLLAMPVDYHKIIVDFYLKIFLLTQYLKSRNMDYYMFSGARNNEWHLNDLKPATDYSFCQSIATDPRICSLSEFSLAEWAIQNDPDCSPTFHLSPQGHMQFADYLYKAIQLDDI
jgi:hypothetical protein